MNNLLAQSNQGIIVSVGLKVWFYFKIHLLYIQPEGIPQAYSSSVFIQLPGDGSTFQTMLNVSLPPAGQLVPGSQTIQCTVIGLYLCTASQET